MTDTEVLDWVASHLMDRIRISGMSMATIAERAKVDRKTVDDMAKGRYGANGAGIITYVKVLGALGVSIGDFFAPMREGYSSLAQEDADRMERVRKMLPDPALRRIIDAMWGESRK